MHEMNSIFVVCYKKSVCVPSVFRLLTAFMALTAVKCCVDKHLSRLVASNRWWNRTSYRLATNCQCFTLAFTHLTSTLPSIIGLQNQKKNKQTCQIQLVFIDGKLKWFIEFCLLNSTIDIHSNLNRSVIFPWRANLLHIFKSLLIICFCYIFTDILLNVLIIQNSVFEIENLLFENV